MCSNRSPKEEVRYKVIGTYAAMYLQGKSIEEIAHEVGREPEDIEKDLRSIKPINPYLYHQIFGDDEEF